MKPPFLPALDAWEWLLDIVPPYPEAKAIVLVYLAVLACGLSTWLELL
jgi:hypothetical protein